MNHISDEDLLRLAELTEEDLPYSAFDREKMEHLKTCGYCYAKFCSSLTLVSVTDDSGTLMLSELYDVKQESPIEQIAREILATVHFAIRRIAEKVDVVLDQAKSARDTLFFQPSLAMATRGFSEMNQSVYKAEDVNDDKTFLALDPASRTLLVQIHTEEPGGARIRAFLQLESGERIEIPLQQKGKLYRGQAESVPADQFQVIIEREE